MHKQFGLLPLKTFPHFSFLGRLYYIFVRKIKNIGLLNYIDYNKEQAMEVIQKELGWKYYGGKHYESIYTRFYQGYILSEKFKIDKRRAHFSSLICSGQMTREQALEDLKKHPYGDENLMRDDKEFVSKKFGLTPAEFEKIWQRPAKRFTDYPSYYPFLKKTRGLVRWAKSVGLLPKRVGI